VRLWCQECDRPSSPDAKGWRLYRTDDEDEFEVTTLAAYCPCCAARELGLERRERRESD
jgi:Zn finger protein HypA/HybF involved in hydrogenase expression